MLRRKNIAGTIRVDLPGSGPNFHYPPAREYCPSVVVALVLRLAFPQASSGWVLAVTALMAFWLSRGRSSFRSPMLLFVGAAVQFGTILADCILWGTGNPQGAPRAQHDAANLALALLTTIDCLFFVFYHFDSTYGRPRLFLTSFGLGAGVGALLMTGPLWEATWLGWKCLAALLAGHLAAYAVTYALSIARRERWKKAVHYACAQSGAAGACLVCLALVGLRGPNHSWLWTKMQLMGILLALLLQHVFFFLISETSSPFPEQDPDRASKMYGDDASQVG